MHPIWGLLLVCRITVLIVAMQENSPSTVGGVIRRYTIKTYEVLRSIPGLTVTYSVWATRSVSHPSWTYFV